MRPFLLLFVLLLPLAVSMTSPAHSHSKVTTTIPPQNAVLTHAPAQLELNFSSPTRVVKALISRNEETTDSLTISTRNLTTFVTLSPAPSKAGVYDVEWRGISEDGHLLKGSFRFTIKETP